jgi:alpha-tubulin suppressor-like RCC1 family protein
MAGRAGSCLWATRLGGILRSACLAATILSVVALAWCARADATQPYEGYEAAVAADSPAAQFRFDDTEGSSEVKDSAGSFAATNHGVVLGAAGPFTGSKSGKFEGSAYASLPGDPLAGDSEFTAEAWVKWEGGSLQQEAVFALGSSSSNYLLLTPQSSSSGHPLAFEIHPSSGSPVIVHTSAKLPANKWEYVAVSEDSSGTLKLYLKGEVAATVNSSTVSPASLGSEGLTEDLLGYLPTNSKFKGKLSNVAFYGKALSEERIKTHFLLTVPPENTVAPTVSGLAKEGQLLTVTEGSWSGSPTVKITYKWQLCTTSCVGISGATKPSFRLTPETVGKKVRANVTDETATGSTTAHSAETATITTGPPVAVKAASFYGEAIESHELVGIVGTWAGTATISYSHEWERCEGESCTPVSSSLHYTLGSADVGKTIRFSVTATNGVGEASSTTAGSATVVASHGNAAVGWGEDFWNNLGVREKAEYEPAHVPVEGVEGVSALASGGTAGYALLEDGTIAAWGGDAYGQLGDGEEQPSILKEVSHVIVKEEDEAEEIVPLEGVRSVSAGNSHAIALLENGAVKTWGGNIYGEMGNGKGGWYYETKEPTNLAKTVTALTPEALAERELPKVVAVEAMDGSNFAILENGELMAWGDDEKGQLGIGEPEPGEEPELCHSELGFERCSTVPRLVRLANGEPLKEVTAVTGSNGTAYARLANGKVMAWGSNVKGGIGSGVKSPVHFEKKPVFNVPPTEVVRVNGEALTEVKEIDAGGGHVLALLESGEVVGWGGYEEDDLLEVANQECAAGEKNEQHEEEHIEKHEPNSQPCVKAATQIIAPGGIGPEKLPITEISVGGKYNALVDFDGQLYTWGQDQYAQDGDGGTANVATPTMVSLPGPVEALTTSKTFMFVTLQEGSPIPPPQVSVTHGVGSFLLQWNFEAERLVDTASHRLSHPENSEHEELTIEEEGPPHDEEAPEIAGEAEEGIRLKAARGHWSGARPLTYKYQWQRCTYEEATETESCVSISNAEREAKGGGAAEDLYKLTSVDVGHTLNVSVTAENAEGTATATSLATEEVIGESVLMNSESKSVLGEREEPITELHEAPLLKASYEMHLTDAAGIHRTVRDKAL